MTNTADEAFAAALTGDGPRGGYTPKQVDQIIETPRPPTGQEAAQLLETAVAYVGSLLPGIDVTQGHITDEQGQAMLEVIADLVVLLTRCAKTSPG